VPETHARLITPGRIAPPDCTLVCLKRTRCEAILQSATKHILYCAARCMRRISALGLGGTNISRLDSVGSASGRPAAILIVLSGRVAPAEAPLNSHERYCGEASAPQAPGHLPACLLLCRRLDTYLPAFCSVGAWTLTCLPFALRLPNSMRPGSHFVNAAGCGACSLRPSSRIQACVLYTFSYTTSQQRNLFNKLPH
jgi:hypothetical protein